MYFVEYGSNGAIAALQQVHVMLQGKRRWREYSKARGGGGERTAKRGGAGRPQVLGSEDGGREEGHVQRVHAAEEKGGGLAGASASKAGT